MKIDAISSTSQAMSDLLKVMADKSVDMSKKLLEANIREQIKVIPNDTQGQRIDTYA